MLRHERCRPARMLRLLALAACVLQTAVFLCGCAGGPVRAIKASELRLPEKNNTAHK